MQASHLLLALMLSLASGQLHADAVQARHAFDTRDFESAEKLFRDHLSTHQHDVSTLLYLSRILLRRNQLDEAEDLIEKAREYSSDEAETSQRAEVLHWYGNVMGRQALEANMFSALRYARKSLHAYQESVALAPTNIEFRNGLIDFYLASPGIAGGDPDKALEHARILFEQDPREGYMALIRCYSANDNRDLLANTFKDAISHYHDDPELLYLRGMHWQTLKKYDQALADFNRAQSIKVNSRQARVYQLGSLYQIGRTSLFAEKNITRGLAALHRYQEQELNDPSLPSAEWAHFREANLMELNAQKNEASKIYAALLKSTEDKTLKKQLKKKT